MPHQELERELRAYEAQEAGERADAASEEQQAQQVRIDEFVAQQEGLSYARPARTRPYHHRGPSVPRGLRWRGSAAQVRPQRARCQDRGDRLYDGRRGKLRSATAEQRLTCTATPANRARVANDGRPAARDTPHSDTPDLFHAPICSQAVRSYLPTPASEGSEQVGKPCRPSQLRRLLRRLPWTLWRLLGTLGFARLPHTCPA